jgi:hypothetical protein
MVEAGVLELAKSRGLACNLLNLHDWLITT